MAVSTGTATAAFARLALDTPPPVGGTYAPEGWVSPPAFFRALDRYGLADSLEEVQELSSSNDRPASAPR